MDEIPPEHKLTCGVDVLDTFAPVMDCSAVRLLISTAFGFGWAVYHWDFYVTNADSHELTCQTSKEFVMWARPTKNLYGSMWAPTWWYKCFCQFIIEIGFKSVAGHPADSLCLHRESRKIWKAYWEVNRYLSVNYQLFWDIAWDLLPTQSLHGTDRPAATKISQLRYVDRRHWNSLSTWCSVKGNISGSDISKVSGRPLADLQLFLPTTRPCIELITEGVRIFIDDLLVTGNEQDAIEQVKTLLG